MRNGMNTLHLSIRVTPLTVKTPEAVVIPDPFLHLPNQSTDLTHRVKVRPPY